MADRPLSPHLMSYKWSPQMLVSIMHRITGDGLAFAGLGVLLWWLGALASGPAAYESFLGHASSWYGMVVLIGISWAFFNHMVSGLRHFVLDVGAGYELGANRAWSIALPILAILITAAFWALILLR